jgi:hypothetical protein
VQGIRAEKLAGGGPPPSPAGAWPPSWQTTDPTAPGGALRRGYPPPAWPSVDQLDYTVKAITALLLVLALPALVMLLLTHPDRLLIGLGRRHVG